MIINRISNLYTKIVKEKIVTFKTDGVTPLDKLTLLKSLTYWHILTVITLI